MTQEQQWPLDACFRRLGIEIRDVKCDTEGCDHYEEGVKVDEFGNYINKPCPKCGAPLMLEEHLAQLGKALLSVAAVRAQDPNTYDFMVIIGQAAIDAGLVPEED